MTKRTLSSPWTKELWRCGTGTLYVTCFIIILHPGICWLSVCSSCPDITIPTCLCKNWANTIIAARDRTFKSPTFALQIRDHQRRRWWSLCRYLISEIKCCNHRKFMSQFIVPVFLSEDISFTFSHHDFGYFCHPDDLLTPVFYDDQSAVLYKTGPVSPSMVSEWFELSEPTHIKDIHFSYDFRTVSG